MHQTKYTHMAMNKQQQPNLPTFLAILHIAIRISIANSPPITDCDEVFNYWEPLHYLLYGYGMQTWEYAPQFALRTYAYLLPMYILSRVYQFLLQHCCPPFLLSVLYNVMMTNPGKYNAEDYYPPPSPHDDQQHKLLVFYLLRSTLSLVTAISEIRLLQSLPTSSSSISSSSSSLSSSSIALFTWICLLTSSGMYHAAPAYLPSATVMVLFMNSLAEQLRGRLDTAILWGIVACLMTGWPFCGILFVPLGVYAICRAYHGDDDATTITGTTTTTTMTSKVVSVVGLLKRVIGYILIIQGFVMSVDYVHYGKIVSPTWNIFVYNTGWGREDGINRDELYGVDDVLYYVKNLVLNWNVLALCSVCSLPLLLVQGLVERIGNKRMTSTVAATAGTTATTTTTSLSSSMLIALLPMYLWMATVFSRPHKEERFLFPIYPLIAVGAVIFLDTFLSWCGMSAMIATRIKNVQSHLILMILLPCALISMSRSMLLTDGYTAPLRVYAHLHHHISTTKNDAHRHPNDPIMDILVCTGGEWHRFPSSFYLPKNVRLAFVKSSFDGQLPQPFTRHGSRVESLSVQKGKFNDLNEEEMDRYVDIQECSYAIELVANENHDNGGGGGDEDVEPEIVTYMQHDEAHWETLVQVDFLNVDATSFVHRVLYLPLFRRANYKKYTLYKRGNL